MSSSLESGKKYHVFISYSREDGTLIEPISQLLKVGREDLVFFDKSDLKAGKKWEEQLLKALDEVALVFVFWCSHAAESEYVRKEFTIAINSGKDIAPVLLDETILPKELADYQWIDFRKLFVGRHERQYAPVVQPGVNLFDDGGSGSEYLHFYNILKAIAQRSKTFFTKMKYNWPLIKAFQASVAIGILAAFIGGTKDPFVLLRSATIGAIALVASFLVILLVLLNYERRIKRDRERRAADISTRMASRDDTRRFTPSEKLKRQKDAMDRYIAGTILLKRLDEIR